MLQHTENVETTSAGTTSPTLITAETTGVEADILAQSLDAELAELAACAVFGTARRKKRIKTFQRRNISFLAVYIVIMLVWVFALFHGFMVPNTPLKMLLSILVDFSFAPIFLGSGLLLWFQRVRITEQERHAAERLLQIDDVRAVGPLLDTMGWQMDAPLAPQRLARWQALGRLLPRMSEDETQELGKDRHGVLASCLLNWDHPLNRDLFAGVGNQIPLGLLHVMGQIGSYSFQAGQPPFRISISLVPTLKRWADGTGAGQDPEVQQAAIACREAIQQKMALARTGAQLLRASSFIPAASDTLLRPTQGVQPTDPQELLRPGEKKA